MLELVLNVYDLQNIKDVLDYAIDQVQSSNGEIKVLSNEEYSQLDTLSILNCRIEKELIAKHNLQRRKVENVLDRVLTDIGHTILQRDWKAFYDDPEDYTNSVVLEMIRQYLRDIEL